MALNYLLHRHQTSLMRAASSGPIEVRRAHEAFAAAYAEQINAMTAKSGGKMILSICA